MEGFDKIKNINLAELDENNRLEDEVKSALPQEPVEDIPQVKEKMDEPTGRHYNIDAEIMEEELRSFLIGHAYRQPMALFMVAVALLIPVYYYTKGLNMGLAAIVSLMILIYFPFTLYLRAKKIKKTNPTFKEIFHYMLDEKGCHLQLPKEAIDVEWKYFKKAMYLKKVVVIYTSKNNGYIIPTRGMGAQQDEIIAFLREKIQK